MNVQKESYSVSSYFLVPLSIGFLGATAFFATARGAEVLAGASLTVFLFIAVLRIWGSLGTKRLDVEFSTDGDRLFSGETFTIRALLANRKILPVWLHAELDRPRTFAPEGSEDSTGDTDLLPFATIRGSWTFRAEARGVFRIGPLSLTASDPLDLHRAERRYPFDREIIVFPRIVTLEKPSLPFMDYFGIHPAKGIIEDPAWYEGTREYSGSRPARNIHWKASARLDVLQEKIFEPTSHQKVFFILDGEGFRAAEDGKGFETALEVLGSLAAHFAGTGADIAAATDRLVKGCAPVLPLGRGPSHLGALLELLARCELSAGASVPSRMAATSIHGASFIVIARAPGPRTGRYFSLPSTRRDRIVFIFARKGAAAEKDRYPSTTFAEILSDKGALE